MNLNLVTVKYGKKRFFSVFIRWLLLGFFGWHKFYLDKNRDAIKMLTINLITLLFTFAGTPIVIFSLVWWLIDLIHLPKMVDEYNKSVSIVIIN